MSKVCITSDCTCDLSEELLDKYGLSDTAIIISFDKEYLEAYREIDKDIEMLYDLLYIAYRIQDNVFMICYEAIDSQM